MPTADDLRTTIGRYVEAFTAGDREGWLALWADDATCEDPVGTDPHVGKEAIGAFWDLSHSMAESIELRISGPMKVVGNEVAYNLQILPTVGGTTMCVDVVETLEFDDDARITKMRAFWAMEDMRPLDS